MKINPRIFSGTMKYYCLQDKRRKQNKFKSVLESSLGWSNKKIFAFQNGHSTDTKTGELNCYSKQVRYNA